MNYLEIRGENFREIERQSPITDDDDRIVACRSHAIGIKRLANCPGFWESAADKDEATRLILEDIKKDFEKNGWQGKLERWITKKLIELTIMILVNYLEHLNRDRYAVAGAASAFGSDISTWATQADECLSEL